MPSWIDKNNKTTQGLAQPPPFQWGCEMRSWPIVELRRQIWPRTTGTLSFPNGSGKLACQGCLWKKKKWRSFRRTCQFARDWQEKQNWLPVAMSPAITTVVRERIRWETGMLEYVLFWLYRLGTGVSNQSLWARCIDAWGGAGGQTRSILKHCQFLLTSMLRKLYFFS